MSFVEQAALAKEIENELTMEAGNANAESGVGVRLRL